MNPETQDKSLFTANVIGALVIGLIAGFLIGAYYVKHSYNDVAMHDNSSMMASSTTGATSTSMAATGETMMDMTNHMSTSNSSITLADQSAGNTVNISSITLDGTYWVTVRDNSTDVKFPYVLGARRVQAGTYGDLVIALSRNTVAGKRYDVVLYKDNGGVFDVNANNIIAVNGNSIALATFTAN